MTDATPATAGLMDNATGLAAIRAHDPGFDAAAYDTIVVRFDDQDPATMARHQACWYFQRSAAATTSADAAGVDRHCPSCGAPLSLALTITKLVNPLAFADHLTTPLTGTVTWTCSITA